MALFKTLSRNYRRYDRNRRYDWAPTHALSLACWFNGNHASFDQHLIGTPVMGYRLFLRSIGGYSFLSADLGVETITNPSPITKATWTHAAMIWNGFRLKLINNGEVVFHTDTNDIRYMEELYGTSLWAFENTIGGNSHQLGLNLFTMWGSALTNNEVEYLAGGGNPANVQFESIRIGDFLDNVDDSGVFGDFMPNKIINEGIITLPPSPFTTGKVPYDVPQIFISSSSSSESSNSSESSLSSGSSSTSLTLGSSLSSVSMSSVSETKSSSESSESSSVGARFSPGTHNWTVPDNVYSIDIRAWAPGGGGGGSDQETIGVYRCEASGGGGGGGEYAEINNLLVTPGDILTITVGLGGAGGRSHCDAILGGLCNGDLSNGEDGENGGNCSVYDGAVEILTIQGGRGGKGGKCYLESSVVKSRGGDGGNGGSTSHTSGSDGANGSGRKHITQYLGWLDGGAGGANGSGSKIIGAGGDGARSRLFSDGCICSRYDSGEDGDDGLVEFDFTFELSSSSSSLSTSSSPAESSSSSTATSETTESSKSSAN